MCVHIHTPIHLHIFMNVRMHIHVHMYTYMYIHIYVQSSRSRLSHRCNFGGSGGFFRTLDLLSVELTVVVNEWNVSKHHKSVCHGCIVFILIIN